MKAIRIDVSITSGDEASLKRYLHEIDKVALIRAEEEVVLAQKIREGDQAALDKLIRANLRFVVSCAKKYQHMGLSLNDLVNEGNLGLIKAARMFDETKGFRFISYAVWWIRQSMMMALGMDTRTIRLPINMVRSISEIRKMSEKLEQQLERAPTLEEIAEVLSIPRESLALSHAFGKTISSLDNSVSMDTLSQLWETMEDPNSVRPDEPMVQECLRTHINAMLGILNEREQFILRAVFGFDDGLSRSLDDIAQMLDVTAERVRQIKNSAISQIRRRTFQKGALYV